MDRRNFILAGGAALLSGCGRNYPVIDFEPTETVPERTGEILDIQNPTTVPEAEQLEIMETNLKNTLTDDRRMITELIGWSYEDIQKFQSARGLTPGGSIGPSTLRKIYRYAEDMNYSFTIHQLRRLNIEEELNNYEADRGRLPTRLPDAFNNRKYFGGGYIADFLPSYSPYIAEGLMGKIPEKGEANTLYVEKLDGKNIIRLYDSLGVLYVATYVSPGTFENKTPDNRTYTTNWTHKYHVSSSYPEEGDRGAPMYAATNVNGGAIWIHSSADTIDGYGHSHGCIRAGLHYAKAVHDYVASGNTIDVVIGDLY